MFTKIITAASWARASVLEPEDRDESDPLGIAGAFMEMTKRLGGYKQNTRLKVTRAEGGRTSYIIWRGLVKNES